MTEVFIVFGARKRKWWFGYHEARVYRVCSTREIAESVKSSFWDSTSKIFIVAHYVQTDVEV